MRRVKQNELEKLASFIVGQFFEKEEMQVTFKGIDSAKAKSVLVKMEQYELLYFYKYGDIFVSDDNITSAVVGIDIKNGGFLKKLPFILKSNRMLSELSKEELKLIKQNSKIIREVHSLTWFKKYLKKKPYYFAQFAVDKDARGKGIARKMLEELFAYIKDKNNYIILETLTRANVPMYEHFGFELKESFESKCKQLKEYRMIKTIASNNDRKISFGKLSKEDIDSAEMK